MQRIPSLYVAPSEIHGQGVFSGEPIEEGALIEICPVIVLSEEDTQIIHETFLHDYYFLWGEAQKESAIVLGYGCIYNHAYEPNAKYLLDYEQRTVDFYAIKGIEAGEEICTNYNGEPHVQTPVWFHSEFKKRRK
jgi:SET domain-containing protein